MFEFSAIPLFFGVAVFDFEGNATVINLYASMKEPKKFNYVLVTTTVIYVLIVAIFSSVAYRVRTQSSNLIQAYGNDIEDIVTLNLPHDNVTSLI